MKPTIAIEFATNMFGTLPAYLKSAIYEYFEFPNQDNWNEIHSYVISTEGKSSTVWQAVIEVDPTFRFSVPITVGDNVRWPKLPSPEVVAKAINSVVFNNMCLN